MKHVIFGGDGFVLGLEVSGLWKASLFSSSKSSTRRHLLKYWARNFFTKSFCFS